MKKVALLFSALALVLGLSQCKKVRPDMPHYSGPVGDLYVSHATVGASYDDGNNSSKVSAAKTIGKELKLTWDENDKLKVQVKGASSSIKDLVLQPESAGSSSGKFDGTITALTGSKLMFLYAGADADYTFNKDGLTVNPANFMNQNGLIQPTKDATHSVMQKLILFADNIDFKAEDAAEYSANMIVPYAILKLDLSKLGTETPAPVTIKVGETTKATVTGVTNTSTEMYVALPTDNLYNDKNPEVVTYTFTNDDSKKSIAMKWKIQQNYFYTAKDTDGDPIEVKPEPQLLPNYVCFEAVQAGSTINLTSSFGVPSDISYSTDGNNWTPFAEAVTLANGGDKCYLKTNTPRDNLYVSLSFMPSYTAPSNFECTGNIKVSGNIMALLNSENPATEMTDANAGCFKQLFQNCEATIDASELVLPATTLAANCYDQMFDGCTSLTAAPNLPATKLAANCYASMFSGCTNLTAAPTISATEVAVSCCVCMFKKCESLVNANNITLWATTLAEGCYTSMFFDCTNLETAPVLKAETFASNSCSSMFSGCSSLKETPAMTITAVADDCCDLMFSSCSKLEDASNISLTASTLANNCYHAMFNKCSELKKSPTMSATTAAFQCCNQMFVDCSKLEDVSKITFAETVAERCYDSMFEGCESLESVSELPAVNLETNCYHLMFSGCAKLSSVTMMATNISGATGCLEDWLKEAGTDGSVSSRTVYVASGMVDDVKATVPDNWKSGVQVKP